MLLISINLSVYNSLFDALRLPAGSVLGITDHNGVRLHFRPGKQSNPIGQPLRPVVWQQISQGGDKGVFLTSGADGHQRYYAWAKARLTPEAPPYMARYKSVNSLRCVSKGRPVRAVYRFECSKILSRPRRSQDRLWAKLPV